MDMVAQFLRYGLISLGTSFLVDRGFMSTSDLNQLVGALILAGSVGWGWYVKKGTTAVPNTTAARTDVPTVSAVTGAVTPATTLSVH